jgi:hypothetical protein
MKNQIYLIKLLVFFFKMTFAGQLFASNHGTDEVNTNLVNASIKVVQPALPSRCIVEMTVTGITDRTLFINKLPQAPSVIMSLVGPDGRKRSLTEKGEEYYSEKSWARHAGSGMLVWLKKNEPIFIKIDLAEFYQLKSGHWILKMNIPLPQIREEGKPRPETVSVEFKDIKIDIPD